MKTRVLPAIVMVAGLAVLLLPSLGSASQAPLAKDARLVVVGNDQVQCAKADVTTISAAVALVRPGGTIRVCAGTYAAGIVVDKPGVTIEALGQPGTVHVVDSGSAASGFGFALVADRVTIDGFEITGFGGAGGASSAGVLVGGIPQPDGSVTPQAADNAVVRDNDIHAALVAAPDPDGFLPSDATGNDVQVLGSANATISGNELSWAGNGVLTLDAPSLHITGNSIHNHGNWGIIAQASTGASIDKNQISRTGEEGVFLNERSDGGQIRGNEILDSFQGIVISDVDGVAISNNIVLTNSGYGIGLSLASHASVTGNTASDNSQTGIQIRSSELVRLSGNTANSNGANACSDDSEDNPCPSGIEIVSSTGVDAQFNETNTNSGRGIRLRNTTASRFSHNSAHANGVIDLDWDAFGSNRFHHNSCDTALPSKTAWDS
jgi:parallel beta-helix repeat protein